MSTDKDIFQFCRMPLCSNDPVFALQKHPSFMRSELLVVDFYVCAVGILFRQYFPVSVTLSIFHSLLLYKIHSIGELCVVWEVRIKFYSSTCRYLVLLHYLLKMLHLLQVYGWLPCQKSGHCRNVDLYEDLSSIPLINDSFSHSAISSALLHCSITGDLSWWCSQLVCCWFWWCLIFGFVVDSLSHCIPYEIQERFLISVKIFLGI